MLIQERKFILTTKSPLHIRSHLPSVTPLEFILSGNYLYLIDMEKLFSLFKNKGIVESYCKEVEQSEGRFVLKSFLESKGFNINDNFLNQYSLRRSKVSGNGFEIREFHSFTRDALGNLYLPGSSIKGTIRTAILYNVLKSNPDLRAEFENFTKAAMELKKSSDDKKQKKDAEIDSSELVNKVFQSFTLYSNQRDSVQKDAKTDWLKMIKVTDAYPLDIKLETTVLPVKIHKKDKNWTEKLTNSGKPTKIWIEAVMPQTSFKCVIRFDKYLLQRFIEQNPSIKNGFPKSLDEVLDCVNIFFSDLQNYEKGFLVGHKAESWYKNNSANFRLGYGSGCLATTVQLLFPLELRRELRDVLVSAQKGTEAPKSRRLYNDLIPLGWCMLEYIK